MPFSRRQLCQSLPLLLATSAWADTNQSIPSFAKTFADLPAQTHGTNTFRPIVEGSTHEGMHMEVHETTLGPGQIPHPPHHHTHEEMFLMVKGFLEVTIASKTATIGPGGTAFVHSGEEHGVKNIGNEPAQYFVVGLGTQS